MERVLSEAVECVPFSLQYLMSVHMEERKEGESIETAGTTAVTAPRGLFDLKNNVEQ